MSDNRPRMILRALGWLLVTIGLIGTVGSLWADQVWLLYQVVHNTGTVMHWIETLIPYYPFVPFFANFSYCVWRTFNRQIL
jgi:uncharacterized membrane protein YbaN (DUF454 family)